MRISFDLDDTLICYGKDHPCEPRVRWPWTWLFRDEPLRLGSRQLFAELRRRGWEIWIYTTSARKTSSVERWLSGYGLKVERIINDATHATLPIPNSPFRPPSKNPGAFGIDLHVDDSEGVHLEGSRFHFRVLVVSPNDGEWVRRVLAAVDDLSSQSLGS